jgi:hypothetical protein
VSWQGWISAVSSLDGIVVDLVSDLNLNE